MKKSCPEFKEAEIFILSLLGEKLSPLLLYHNREHTLDVLQAAMKIAEAERISAAETELLRTAVLFHDAGFIYIYKNHEEKSCEMAQEYLPGFHFLPEQITMICEMIMATKVPQDPKTRLGQIIADADLDYLGREDVFSISQKLFDERRLCGLLPDTEKWLLFQIDFLRQHRYFTSYSREFREPNKKLYLQALLEKGEH